MIIKPGPSPTNQKAAPKNITPPYEVLAGPLEGAAHGNTAGLGAASLPVAREAAAVPPGADSDGMAVSDSPVPLPDPTLDGEGAGGTDPFEIPHFLRRTQQV